jgi:TM2 domain-containing membrane protein YozV
MSENNPKVHPGTAAVLSFIFSGLGQLYNGQIFKGLVIIFFSAASIFIFILGSILIWFWLSGKSFLPQQLILGVVFFASGIISICILGIYSIYDAFLVAKKR